MIINQNIDEMNKKVKLDFLEWVKKEYPLLAIHDIIPNTCINALKIEWFDSVGIQIGFIPIQGGDTETYLRVNKFEVYNIDYRFETRQEATEKAIEKAVEIYNNLK